MLKKKLTILNKLGLHARAAAKFVAHANRYASNLTIIKNGKEFNGKSIMAVMLLEAGQGSKLDLVIDGEDEVALFEDLKALLKDHFGEPE
jgi:phosphocarrier protein HPr